MTCTTALATVPMPAVDVARLTATAPIGRIFSIGLFGMMAWLRADPGGHAGEASRCGSED